PRCPLSLPPPVHPIQTSGFITFDSGHNLDTATVLSAVRWLSSLKNTLKQGGHRTILGRPEKNGERKREEKSGKGRKREELNVNLFLISYVCGIRGRAGDGPRTTEDRPLGCGSPCRYPLIHSPLSH